MLQDMTVVDKRPQNLSSAEIHADFNARVRRTFAIPVRHVYGVAYGRFVHFVTVALEQLEMKLMNVERVGFTSTILEDPIFDRPLTHGDVRLFEIHIESFRSGAVQRDEISGWLLRVFWVLLHLREIQLSRTDWHYIRKSGEVPRRWERRQLRHCPGCRRRSLVADDICDDMVGKRRTVRNRIVF